jgi:hypothetical protein
MASCSKARNDIISGRSDYSMLKEEKCKTLDLLVFAMFM